MVTDGANVVDGVVKEVRVKGVVAVVKHYQTILGWCEGGESMSWCVW